MELDLRQLMRIARRRGWLLLLIMVVAGAAAYWSSSRQTPEYEANATMLVNPGQSTVDSDYSALQASRSLAETYRLLVETGPVFNRVIDVLGLPMDVDELDEMVSTSVVGETQLVQVTVSDTDPERAALIANTIVDEFQTYISEQATERAETTRSDLDAQIGRLEDRLDELDAQIDELNTSENADDPEIQQQIEDLTQDRANVNQALTELNTTAITFSTEVMAASAQVEMADPATVPSEPYAPRVMFSTLLGLLVGLLIGVGLVALLEFLDNTVKQEMDIQSMIDAPVLARISSIPSLPAGSGQVFTLSQPHSIATEAMRLLRTNLDFAAATSPIATLAITSPGPAEGKSTVTANLGVVMAQAGFNTVILDADLRRPSQHRIFGIENAKGMTTLLTAPDAPWQDVATKVALPGLTLVPTGPLPPNPSDLLSSNRFHELLDKMQADVDLVLIDTPPMLAVSDPLAVATHTDGVVLVAAARKTRVDGLVHAAHAVEQGGIRLVGAVVNRTRGQEGGGYYYEYYGPEQSAPKPKRGPLVRKAS